MRLATSNVGVTFGRRTALEAINVEFREGVTAIFGANGAGKSTLLEVLANVRQPRTGKVDFPGVAEIHPRSGRNDAYRKVVAWLPQEFVPFPRLTVREHVSYAGWLKGMSKVEAWNSAPSAIDQVGLSDLADRKVKELSGGQKRRVGLAGALVHDAQVVLLDEPTAGLDPVQRDRLRGVLTSIADTRIVLVSSHDTDGADTLFDRAVVLRSGSVTFQGTMTEFLQSADSVDVDPQKRLIAAYLRWAGTEEG